MVVGMRAFALLGLLLVAACGETTPSQDFGLLRADAGVVMDAAFPPDAEVDAGAADSGPGPDTGSRAGCDEARFRLGDAAFEARGPWPVGVRTATIAGLTADIWYPATLGSEAGLPTVQYDLRSALPSSEQGKIPDADNPFLDCDCYRDLPVDETYGPYPLVVFVHGTAGFRAQSLAQTVHWASRGFIVVSADYPGLWLKDVLGAACGQGMVPRDDEGNLRRLVSAVQTGTTALAFLGDRLDATRVGMSGHSAGGSAIEGLGDVAQVLAPLAAGGVMAGSELQSVLVMGGSSDRVVPLRRQIEGYTGSPRPKRLVALDNAGHLAFSTFCALQNESGQNIVEVAMAAGVCGTALASFLFDCNPAYLDDARAWTIVNHATTAAFEAQLQCRSDAEAALGNTMSLFSEVSDYREE